MICGFSKKDESWNVQEPEKPQMLNEKKIHN